MLIWSQVELDAVIYMARYVPKTRKTGFLTASRRARIVGSARPKVLKRYRHLFGEVRGAVRRGSLGLSVLP